jgi:hypothetical protein
MGGMVFLRLSDALIISQERHLIPARRPTYLLNQLPEDAWSELPGFYNLMKIKTVEMPSIFGSFIGIEVLATFTMPTPPF